MTIPESVCLTAASSQDADEAAKVFQFCGQHLVASYSGCDASLLVDRDFLVRALKDATAAAGATVLDCSEHIFPNGAVTAVMLLAESHASIHTYPEHGACFVDLFTCGEDCDLTRFDQSMQQYLRPQKADVKIFVRDAGPETKI